jgi:hypothetical protein
MREDVLFMGVVTALGIAACKAESVGVEVPRGGPQAVSMEDLQRDAWLVGGGGGTDGWTALERRLQQMHTLPAFGADHRAPGPAAVVCGRKEGREAELDLVLAVREGAGAGLLRLAALVSLAKAWDLQRPPAHTLVLCGVDGAAGLEALRAAPVAPPDRVASVWVLGGPDSWGTGLGSEVQELPLGALPEDAGAVDFRQLQQRVVAAHGAVTSGW